MLLAVAPPAVLPTEAPTIELLPIATPVGVLAVLSAICAGSYWVERTTRWRLFDFFPPLVFIYAIPAVLVNLGVLPASSPIDDGMSQIVLPTMIVLLLLELDVIAAVRIMGRGLGVMLFGTLGVVVGAPIGYALVKSWLEPGAWKAFGALSGSWVGGTANLAAVAEMIEAGPAEKGLAVLGDTAIYLVWLPVLMGSKAIAGPFARLTRVPADRLENLDAAAAAMTPEARIATFRDYLNVLAVGLGVAWIAYGLANILAGAVPFFTSSTWRILLATTIAIGLSMTPLRRLPASRELGTALVLLFMAHMGSTADVRGIAAQAVPFLAGALVWILIHGAFCVAGARLFRVDVHTAALASGANIGGAATVTQVALHHRPGLLPVGLLMAMIGYALGNYTGLLAAKLCELVSRAH